MNMTILNTLGTIINTSYGKSSTRGNDKGYALKYSLTESGVKLSFNALFQFASEKSLQEQVDNLKKESNQLIKDDVNRVVGKLQEETGETLSLKSIDERDNIEMVSASVHSPIRRAVYRREIFYQID
mgnify:CR=1 FL=1